MSKPFRGLSIPLLLWVASRILRVATLRGAQLDVSVSSREEGKTHMFLPNERGREDYSQAG